MAFSLADGDFLDLLKEFEGYQVDRW